MYGGGLFYPGVLIAIVVLLKNIMHWTYRKMKLYWSDHGSLRQRIVEGNINGLEIRTLINQDGGMIGI